jgi:hypothetical protein
MSVVGDFFSQDSVFYISKEIWNLPSVSIDLSPSVAISDYYQHIVNAAIAEYAIMAMLKKELERAQWTIVDFPCVLGGNHIGSQIIATKNTKTLAVILGDGYDVNHTQKIDPDYVIACSAYDFVPGAEHAHIDPEIYGIYKDINATLTNRQPTKLFNCFISATDGYRQCWFYNFVRRGYLEQAHISFLLNRSPEFTETTSDEKIKFYNENKNISFNNIFDVEHNLMLDRVPYKNFSGSLEEAIIDSKCSVVLESSYARPGQIYFTEKTFRAMQSPRPFFIAARQGGGGRIAYLRKIGFDVYDDIVDHSSYDDVDDPIQQMSLILDQLEKLQKIEYTPDLLKNFEQRAQHNQNLTRKLNRDLVTKYQNIVDKIKEIS